MSTRRSQRKRSGKSGKLTPESSGNSSKSTFDVILSFREREQIFLDPFIVPKGISEAGFVQAIFAELNDADLAELVKISACMHYTADELLEGWIPPRHGKFYLNPDVNDDEDTVRWATQKNSELVRRQKH